MWIIITGEAFFLLLRVGYKYNKQIVSHVGLIYIYSMKADELSD